MTYLLTHASWKLHGSSELHPFVLLLESDGVLESSGVTTSQLSAARGYLLPDLLEALHGSGVQLDETELAVHARLAPLIGHGAFAAVHVNLVPPRSLTDPQPATTRATPTDIATGESSVGMLDDGVSGAPYIALAHGSDLTDCLLLTWSGDWAALRTYLRTDFLRPGCDQFTRAMRDHKDRVVALLGPPGVLSAMKPGGCVN